MSMTRVALPTLLIFALGLSACTWVQPDEGAEEILELPERRVGDCERLGSVRVKTADRILFLDRHEDKIQEEQRTLARNHALEEGGDTIVPLGESEGGERRFGIYRCEGTPTDEAASEEGDGDDDDGVTVRPYNGD